MFNYPPDESEIRDLYEYTLELYPELRELNKIKPESEDIISDTWWEIGAFYEQKTTVENRLKRNLDDVENQKDAFANLLWLIHSLTNQVQ